MMHSVILKVFLLSIHTIFPVHLAQSDTTVILCPDIAYLGSSAQITCSTSADFNNTIYNCPCEDVLPQCVAESNCTNVSGYSARIVNKTQTELTIFSVQPKHAGNWSCTGEGKSAGTTFCHLVVAKIPSVNITSDVDADSVNLGDTISLTMDILDYHCSESYRLTLQLGIVNYTPDPWRNATIKHLTKTVPIHVTQAHFGNVTLVFVCGAPTTEIPTLLTVAAGVTPAVIIILIITIACCCCCCRKKVNQADTSPSSLPSESNTTYPEAGISFQDVRKSNGINGSSESCDTQCSVVTLRDTKDLHDNIGNGGSIYDRLYMN